MRLLQHHFEDQVDRAPMAAALVVGGYALSYHELERRANQYAWALSRLGLGPGARVGLLLPRGIDHYAALLGILKSGGLCVPIDPAARPGVVRGLAERCELGAVVTLAALAQGHLPAGLPRLLADADVARLMCEETTRPPLALRPDAPCYLFPGAAGAHAGPGEVVTHRAAWHRVAAEGRRFLLAGHDRVWMEQSAAGDAAMIGAWLAFQAGAAQVIPAPQETEPGAGTATLLSVRGVSTLTCTPAFLASLGAVVPSLRLLILGDGECPPSLVERWAAPDRRMFRAFGPAELAS